MQLLSFSLKVGLISPGKFDFTLKDAPLEIGVDGVRDEAQATTETRFLDSGWFGK